MARAWDARRSNRTWQKHEEILMLTEVCRIHPSAGPRAAAFISQAPIAQLAPGFVSALTECDWARDVLDKWMSGAETPEPVKKAIVNARKK
jgi:hypothetical protein